MDRSSVVGVGFDLEPGGVMGPMKLLRHCWYILDFTA